MHALRLVDVRIDFPRRPRVLDGVSFTVARGGLLVLQGRSGSGKSTLLALCAGLQRPSSGVIEVMGERIHDAPEARRADLRARHVGLVLQHLHLLGELTLAQNVALPLHLAGWKRTAQQERSKALLKRFGLQDLAQRRPGQCSGGEQQRAAIARALALRPGLLLVDEPTSALDARNAASVGEALLAARDEGAAVVVATHDEALHRLGPGLRLLDGRLEAAR